MQPAPVMTTLVEFTTVNRLFCSTMIAAPEIRKIFTLQRLESQLCFVGIQIIRIKDKHQFSITGFLPATDAYLTSADSSPSVLSCVFS